MRFILSALKSHSSLPCFFSFLFSISVPIYSSASQAQPSIEDFVKHPRFEGGQLSPSGKYLALARRNSSVQGILVVDLETMAIESGTHFGKNEDVWDFFWANDERLLIEPALRAPAIMSYKAPTGELVGMNADGSNLRRLSGFRVPQTRTGTLLYNRNAINSQGEVFDLYTQDKDHVLVQAAGGSGSTGYTKAFLLNINNGKTKVVGRSKIRYGSFVADTSGLPTINIGANDDNETEVYFRANNAASFQLKSRNQFGSGTILPISSIEKSAGYYVLENKSGDTLGLSRWFPNEPDIFETVFRHANVDIDSVVTDSKGKKIVAIKYHDPLPNYFYPDENLAIVAAHKRMREQFPGRDVVIESLTDNLDKAVINVTGDIYPDQYYLLNANTEELERIFVSQPQLENQKLAKMQPVSFPSRDGLTLNGFLTVPAEPAKQSNLPLVVLVHGGPYGLRDQWGYDFEVQLLASRGYAVLQVNFRGSPGYGLQYQAAGIGEWGNKMQNDITDATQWAIDQGISDENRICIYGSSYGGYAALMGTVREPQLYQCAIGYAGVYDLAGLFENGAIQNTSQGESYLNQVLGQNKEVLEQRSPRFNADKITASIMIAHGRKDTIAPYAQAKSMRRALINAGNEPQFFIEAKEGHGFFGQRSRMRYYTELLAFLEKNIGTEPLN